LLVTSSIALAHGASVWGDALEPVPDWDLFDQPASDVEFDQSVSW
jgi:hypothetical protein